MAIDIELTDLTYIKQEIDDKDTAVSASVTTVDNKVIALDTRVTNVETKTDFVTVTQAVDLDAIESDTATNASNTSTNTTDIANNTLALVDIGNGTSPVKGAQFSDVTSSEPAYVEGQEYYANGVKNIQGKYNDVTLQVGREQHLEVVNNTGADIPNGSLVRHNGVSNGEVQVVLALADTFINARILGVATHTILDGSLGVITTFGIVGDIDTYYEGDGVTQLETGKPLFLSDTYAGKMTTTAPDTAVSQVGGALIKDATAGKLSVNIDNNIALPTISGFLQGLVTQSLPITTTPTAFNTYIPANTSSHYIAADDITGTFTVPNNGLYTAKTLVSLSGANSINSPQDVLVQAFVNGVGSGSPFPLIIGRNGTRAVGTPFEEITLLANDTIDFRYWSNTTDGQTLTFELVSFSLVSIKIEV